MSGSRHPDPRPGGDDGTRDAAFPDATDLRFERDLRDILAQDAPREVPMSLSVSVAAVTRQRDSRAAGRAAGARRGSWLALAGLAAVLVAAVGVGFLGLGRPATGPVTPGGPGSSPAMPTGLRLTLTVEPASTGTPVTPAAVAGIVEQLRMRLDRIALPGATVSAGAAEGTIEVVLPVDPADPQIPAMVEETLTVTGSIEGTGMPAGQEPPSMGDRFDTGAAGTTPLFGPGDIEIATVHGTDFGPVVRLVLQGAAVDRFAEYTRANLAGWFVITMDGGVVSAPMINEPITAGMLDIGGTFEERGARELAAVAASGPLPLRLTVAGLTEIALDGPRQTLAPLPSDTLPVPTPAGLVTPAPASTVPGITTGVTDGPFIMELTIDQAAVAAGQPITGQAVLTHDGGPTVVSGSGDGVFTFSYTEAGGDRRVLGAHHDDCVPWTMAGGTISSSLTKSGGYSADDPNAAFIGAFLSGPDVLLPPGTWDITAEATFADGQGCTGAWHTLRSTVRITVH